MSNTTFQVRLMKNGVVVVNISAATQAEAKRIAMHQYPGYRYLSSKRI